MGNSAPGGMANEQIPILDCSRGLENLAGELVFALKHHGFVYLVNHGVSSLWIETALSEADRFFTLSHELKLNYKRKYTDFGDYRDFCNIDSGYTAIRQESIRKLSNPKEPIDTDCLRECYDVVFQDGKYLTFPDEHVPNFRPAAIRILKAMSGLGLQVLRGIGNGLKLEDPDVFYKCHKKLGHNGNVSALRFSHYPPIYDRRPILPYTRSGGENVSFGTIILVIQDQNEGLEGSDSRGNFRPIPPLKNAILVTSGELMHRWTSGKVWAPSARVQIPQDVTRRARRRNVILYYLIPDNDVVVAPLDGSDTFEPVMVGEYMSKKLVKMFY